MSSPTLLEPPSHLDGPPPPPPPRTGYPGDDGAPPPQPESSGGPSLGVFAMWVTLVPVFMLFGALIVAYVVRKDFGEQWQSLPMPGVLWWNTLILVGSSVALEWSRRTKAEADRVFRGYGISFALGSLFVVGQIIAWVQYLREGVFASSSPHAGFFYILTAAHAAHVLGGLVGLGILAWWRRRTWRFADITTVSRITAVYWHFLGLMWLTLFLMLEFWR